MHANSLVVIFITREKNTEIGAGRIQHMCALQVGFLPQSIRHCAILPHVVQFKVQLLWTAYPSQLKKLQATRPIPWEHAKPNPFWASVTPLYCILVCCLWLSILGTLTIYNTHTLKPFKELGLDSQGVKKLASKLHVHSVNFAAKLFHTRSALSSTVINCHQEPVSGKACNPPDPHRSVPFRLVEEFYGTRY